MVWYHFKSDARKVPTDDDPMTNLSWNEVQAYLKWAGKRLPTEKERESKRAGLAEEGWGLGDCPQVSRFCLGAWVDGSVTSLIETI